MDGHARAVDAPAVATGAGAPGRVSPAVFWLTATLACLLFLYFPLADLARAHPSPGRLAATLAGMATFVGLYLWLMVRGPILGAPLSAAETRRHVLLLAVIAGVVLALTVAASPDYVWFVLYANMVAGVKLPVRAAAATIAGQTVLVVGGTAATLGWRALNPAFATIVSVSILLIGVAWMIATIQALRAARQEIARLAAAEAVVAERLRFARDLHDLLGHSLSAITLKGEVARRLLRDDPDRAERELGDALAAAREALREVREAVSGYRQPTLAAELRGAREILAAAGIACTCEGDAGPLPPAVAAVLTWAVREGVTNVVRHSRARRCTIRLGRADGAASVEIADDGAGVAPASDAAGPGGHGLRGLAERAAQRGGAVEAGPDPAGGFRLLVTVPAGDDRPAAGTGRP
ncbi:MAG TPA: histidine kinase [Thermomicrobiales bacterium]|nr:histidine kinase [Thermomicrobiales bacterium]